MKSGGKILEHQNHDAGVQLRAIALDAVIAWRIMLLALLGRTMPGLPADLLFDPCECGVLALPGSKKLSPGGAMIVIARLGGCLNRHRDGPPGFECLGRGYTLFDAKGQIMQLHHAAAASPRRAQR